jgi:hypothetical protein
MYLILKVMVITCSRDPTSSFESRSSSARCRLIGSVDKFRKFIEVESDHTPKREIIPDDLVYKCGTLKKLLKTGSICFNGLNTAIHHNFQSWRIFLELA